MFIAFDVISIFKPCKGGMFGTINVCRGGYPTCRPYGAKEYSKKKVGKP